MKKKLLTTVIAILTLCTNCMAGIIESGVCGKNGSNVTWTLDSDGLLKIEGEGEMADYDPIFGKPSPWIFKDIKKAIIEKGITCIGERAFAFCTSLSSITISNDVTTIKRSAFSSCSSLTSLDIPSSVTSMGNHAFSGSSITSITISDNLKSISYGAFQDCKNLKYVIIQEGVDSIGELAFDGCRVLDYIEIPQSISYIGKNAFQYCYALKTNILNNSSFNLSEYKLTECDTETKDGLLIKDDIVECSKPDVEFVEIPDYVKCIGKRAFFFCTTLTSITIPNSVTSIGEEAFLHCTSINSITIPNSVTTFGTYAFSDCTSLISVTIPNNMSSIGYGAFRGCSSLRYITIPSSVTTIGARAFADCPLLSEIHINNPFPPYLENDHFSYSPFTFANSSVNTCILYVPVGSRYAYSQAREWEEFTYIIEEDVSSIINTNASIPCGSHTRKIMRKNRILIEKDNKHYNTDGIKM